MTGNVPVSLYFHIPFCSRKCDYCHFYVLPNKKQFHEQLNEGLALEWQHWQQHLKNRDIATIYFGGGTPALWGPQYIDEVLQRIAPPSHIEITLEANPENITPTLIKEYVDVGINRISIGIQSFDDHLLKKLSRTHTPENARQAIYNVRQAGIHNISIDLMYDIPSQTLEQWDTTLQQSIDLPITHLSLYNLTFEPHTVFFKRQNELKPLLPNTSTEMYTTAITMLEDAGLQQYEISAFAKEGYQSQHNTGYWTGRDFIGFGPSAFSYWKGKRFHNIAHLNKYLRFLRESKKPIDFEEQLSPEAHRRELFTLCLRLKEGCHLKQFEDHHGPLDEETKKIVEQCIEQGLIKHDEDYICLTKRGILFYDTIASELI